MSQDIAPMNSHSVKKSWIKDNWFVVLVVIVLLYFIFRVVEFFVTHERVEGQPIYQQNQQAISNRFYASKLLLEKNGKQVKSSTGDNAVYTLKEVWRQPASQAKKSAVMLYTISKEQEQTIPDMLAWVERGGHLITFSQDRLYLEEDKKIGDDKEALNRYFIDENQLFNELGIINHTKSDNYGHYLSDENIVNLSDKVLLRLPSENNKEYIGAVVTLSTTRELNTERFWKKYPNSQEIADYRWITLQKNKVTLLPTTNNFSTSQQQAIIQKIDPKNIHRPNQAIFDVKMGQGRVTIFNESQIFTNPRKVERELQTTDKHDYRWQLLLEDNYKINISRLDNAYLLQYLLTNREQIWLVPDVSMPNLIEILWRNMKWACIAFMICLLMGFLALPKRFGRTKTYQTDSERNIFGYFDHVGQYLWATDEARAIVAENRYRLLEKIIARYPELVQIVGQMPEPYQVCQKLARETNLSPNAIQQALYDDWQNSQQFLQISRQFALVNRYYLNSLSK